MLEGIIWVIKNIGLAFWNFGYVVTHPGTWLDWSNGESLGRFIYYGASVEFFFVVFTAFLCLTAVGLWHRPILWGTVRGLEGLANGLGRTVAWVGLIMVLQQIVIVFLQRIFAASAISLAPAGYSFTRDISWWSEELKLWNAMIVCLCVTYTFVQGGHVRVDLLYSSVSYRSKRIIDMAGSLLLMMPAAVLTWLYAWFFLWRNLVTPKVSASESLEMVLRKSKIMKWSVETIGFSPNGFDAYFLFKVLMVAFCGLVFLHAIAFFYRSLLEYLEGPESEGKYLDRDTLGQGQEAYEGTH